MFLKGKVFKSKLLNLIFEKFIHFKLFPIVDKLSSIKIYNASVSKVINLSSSSVQSVFSADVLRSEPFLLIVTVANLFQINCSFEVG